MADTQTYNYNEIQRYLQHTMTPQEMHDFEKALMNDPFLADALDGFLAANSNLTVKHLSELESSLTGQSRKAKVVSMLVQRTRWWTIAAAAIVLIISGGLIYKLNVKPMAEYKMAQQNSPGKAAEITRNADSIKSPETPMARVAISPEIKKHSQFANASLSKKNKEKPVAATNKIIQKKTGSQSVVMEDKSENVSALINKNANVATALNAPATANASRMMESKKVAGNASDNDTISKKENISSGKIRLKDNEAAAEPKGGWKNFESYILGETKGFRANISNYNKQEIELEFSINNGNPDNIKVSEQADKLLAQKAIEILKNGPGWTSKKKDKTVKLIIPF